MTHPEDPKTSFKALLLDYDYLLTKSEAECCYSLFEREVQILLPFIDYVGWKTRYKKTETEIDTDLISGWSGTLAKKLMSGCCPDDGKLHRYLPDGTYQTSTDGGATWVDDPDGDPRSQSPLAPPLPGTPGSALRCAAADNVRDQYKQMRDNTIALLTAGTTVLEITAGLVALIGLILGISVVGISFGVILFSLAGFLLTLTPESVAEQIDDTALDSFRCIIYCHLDSSGRVKIGEFDEILAEIQATFDDFPELFFYSITATMLAAGINNAATMGVATASDCDDCDCGEWCYTFDFETTNGGFTIIPSTGGFYDAGNGWKSNYWVGVDGNGYRTVDIQKTFTATITSLDVSIHLETQGSPPYPSNWVYAASNVGALITSGATPVAPLDIVLSWTGTQAVTGLPIIQASAGFELGGDDPGGEVIIKTITLRGIGTNPFGDDNCE